jgi:tetratricopeptide (TPR) repeat protein
MTQTPPRIDATLRSALQQHEEGNLREAERGYRAVLDAQREHPVALLYLGVLHYDHQRHTEAIALIRRAIEIQPREPAAHNHLGLALLATQRVEDAVRSFQTALHLRPDYADALNNLGNALKKLKQYEAAEAAFRRILQREPGNVLAHYNLGLMQFERRDFAQAQTEFEAALALDGNFFKARYQLGLTAELLGRFADAARSFEQVLQLQPDHLPTLAALLALRDYQPDDALVERTERIAKREDLPRPHCYSLCYSLAKRFEGRGDYSRAFGYLQLANERRGRVTNYEPQRVDELFENYRRVFTRDLIQRCAQYGSDSERPVFVVGMPRTGTTLVEQILAAHPAVFGAGELPDLPRIANRLPAVATQVLGRAVPPYPLCVEQLDERLVASMARNYLDALERSNAQAARVVDKNPFNFLNVGLIAMLFPRARILHCERNPLDVGVSCYSEFFELRQDFTTDFERFAHYFSHYRRLMDHWREILPGRLLDLSYEQLVTDTREVTQRMVDFCGLPWDEACLQFQQTERPVLTPSKWQVRQPIYRSSMARWRRYEAHIAPLERALAERGITVR